MKQTKKKTSKHRVPTYHEIGVELKMWNAGYSKAVEDFKEAIKQLEKKKEGNEKVLLTSDDLKVSSLFRKLSDDVRYIEGKCKECSGDCENCERCKERRGIW